MKMLSWFQKLLGIRCWCGRKESCNSIGCGLKRKNPFAEWQEQ